MGKYPKHEPKYRRCYKCDDRRECTAMCVDVCVDEVNRLGARKALRLEQQIDDYEYDRTLYIQTKGDWGRLQKKRRGY